MDLRIIILFSVLPMCLSLHCAYRETRGISLFNRDSLAGTVLADNVTMQCPEDEGSKCFSSWADDEQGFDIFMQGCMSLDQMNDCSVGNCSSSTEIEMKERIHYFCCCLDDYCNFNVTIAPKLNVTENVNATTPTDPEDGQFYILYIIVISVVSLIAIFILIVSLYYFHKLKHRKLSSSGLQPPYAEVVPPEPDFNMDDLKLLTVIGTGRYCNVYKAILADKQVAVKVFSGQSRECYLNEIDIYSVPHIGHDNLLKFIGTGENIGDDGFLDYYLVTELINHGSLMSYLKENTYDWHGMCKLAQTATAGLAHLHLSSKKGGLYKPAIVHRDINTRNILVRLDGTCVIGDFGFTMKVCGSNIVGRGRGDNSNITDVGTVRYMAPEVLDGAVNLRDCECALKQVDIYSLGLVLWELATRCKDLYPGTVPPDYKMPFQDEVGNHPSFADMQVFVSVDRRRPAFPDEWKDNHTALRSLKGTIEESWDHDAEARLTALCVEERIIELLVLWDKHRSVTPTINSMAPLPPPNDNGLSSPILTEENETRSPHDEYNPRTPTDILNDLNRRHDKPISGGMEKNERQMLLSPDTISTSLSSPSELNLIDLTCAGQSVDPKNLHHSDDSIERFTTDLKYGSMHKPLLNHDPSHEEYSNTSEPTISPTQGLMVNEMPPPLSRHQMTDNLLGENRRRSQRSNSPHPHKADVNLQRQLAMAAERGPPSYEQVTAGDAISSPQCNGNLSNSTDHENTSPTMNKRPSSLPLTPDANGQRKKMVAVYKPDSGPTTRVETEIVQPENDPGCSANTSFLTNGDRPQSVSYDASVDSEQSMSDTSSQTSSISGSTENVNGLGATKKDKRRGTPYRLLDKKLAVHNGKPSENGVRQKKGSSPNSPSTKTGSCSAANNNLETEGTTEETVGLLQNGNTPVMTSLDKKTNVGEDVQVSMV